MFHWESPKIEGFFENVSGRWYIRVNCEKYGIFPEMLNGRQISVKGATRRLGDYIPGVKRDCCYFFPWPDNIGKFVPPPPLAWQARRLYTVAARGDIKKEVFALRIALKEEATKERARRMAIPPWPSQETWERWTLEYLDGVLLSLAGAELAPLPPNQFEYVAPPELSAVSFHLASR